MIKIRMKKRTAPILTALLMIAVTFAFTPQLAAPAYAKDGNAQSTPAIVLVKDGNAPNIEGEQKSSVYFGNYWQSNSTKKDPIKWRVLDKGTKTNPVAEKDYKGLFLLSDQNLDVMRYNESNTGITWEDCTMRRWLNSISYSDNYGSGGFLSNAFSWGERFAISYTTVVNGDNPDNGTSGGNNTQDEVFLLSIEEATDTNYGFTHNYDSTETRIATNTKYVADGGRIDSGYVNGVGAVNSWWLRSPGRNSSDRAAYASESGHIENDAVAVRGIAVRPAFNLNLESLIFTSAAVGGKSSNGVGADALEQVGINSTDEWKLTFTDKNHKNFAVTKTTASDNGVSVTYKDAVTGTNEYISAIITDKPITDKSAKITYYGRIAKASDAADASVTFNTAGKLKGNDHLYIFNEQYNGDKMTDYASGLKEINFPAMHLGTDVLAQYVNTTDAQTVWYADKTWFVIGYNGSGAASESDAATLLSVNNLDQTKFDDSENHSYVYADSTLKTKVDTIAESLSDGEKGAVVKKTLTSGTYNGDDTDCVAGSEVKDTLLWPLSTKEANALNEDLRIVHSDHTVSPNSDWWLRSPGYFKEFTARVYVYYYDDEEYYVGYFESVTESGIYVGNILGVRPAFNLNLKSVLLTSAADGGKSSNGVGADTLKAQSDQINSTDEWKLTIHDSGRDKDSSGNDVFKASRIDGENLAAGKTLKISYSGAKTGSDKEFVSAIITDSQGKVLYYGHIASTKASASGTATVKIPEAANIDRNCKLYVFQEQCNGDKKTDYSSKLHDLTKPVSKVSYTVTFKVKNGAWNNGKTNDKTVKLSRYKNENKALVLQSGDIPAVGNKPAKNYKKGSWDVTPNTSKTIAKNTTYTYTYAKSNTLVYYTVTFADGQGKTLKKEKVQRGKSATAPAAPKRSGYTFTGWNKDFSKVTGNMTVTAKWKKNASRAVSTPLLAKMTAKGKRSLKISWTGTEKADGYDVFLSRCSHGKKRIVLKKVKTIKAGKGSKKGRALTWTKKHLKKKKAYKAVVKAWVMKNGRRKYVRSSPMVHAYTSGVTKNYSNVKKITVKKSDISLKAGRTFKVRAKVKKLRKGKRLMPKSHTARIRYLSTNKKIAAVNRRGKITARSKGTCTIYVYAHNGVSKKVKVTVR